MKIKRIIIGLLMLFCLNVFGQQQKTIPMTVLPQKTEVQVLEETILQLQAENQVMQKQLEGLEKEVEYYRGDVRTKVAELDDAQSRWLTLLSIVIGAIVMILGVGVPLVLNNKSEKYIEKMLSDAKQEATSAKEQAEKAEKALNSIQPQVETVKEQVTSVTNQVEQAKQAVADIGEIKEHIDAIEKRINEDTIIAEKAAKEVKSSQLSTQAFSEEDSSKAVELYTKAIELNPENSIAYINRGGLMYKLGNIERAMKDFDEAIRLDSNNAMAYYNRGIVKDDMGDEMGALRDYDKSIETNPSFATAYNNRGNLKKKMNNNQGALKDYDRAIELDPNNAIIYYNRGNLKQQILTDYEGALKDYDKAIELNQSFVDAYNNRASALIKLKEYNRALDCVNEAIMIDGNRYVFWNMKGEICMMMKNFEGAVFSYTKALVLNSKDMDSLENRAKCYREMAKVEQNSTKKSELIAKAEADEQEVSSLK